MFIICKQKEIDLVKDKIFYASLTKRGMIMEKIVILNVINLKTIATNLQLGLKKKGH